MLEILLVIEKEGRNINRGKVEVALDNSKVHREIVNAIVKLYKQLWDTGAEVVQIKRLLKKLGLK